MYVVRCETLKTGRRQRTNITDVTTWRSSADITEKKTFRLHRRSSSLKMVAAVSSQMLAPSVTLQGVT
jgi:hypothetical protein